MLSMECAFGALPLADWLVIEGIQKSTCGSNTLAPVLETWLSTSLSTHLGRFPLLLPLLLHPGSSHFDSDEWFLGQSAKLRKFFLILRNSLTETTHFYLLRGLHPAKLSLFSSVWPTLQYWPCPILWYKYTQVLCLQFIFRSRCHEWHTHYKFDPYLLFKFEI